jgi:hypothetical protein
MKVFGLPYRIFVVVCHSSRRIKYHERHIRKWDIYETSARYLDTYFVRYFATTAMFSWKLRLMDGETGLHFSEGLLKSKAQLELGKGAAIGKIAFCAATPIAICFTIWLGPL